MVWEADEPNLTAQQERRPWSPPPGPRPGEDREIHGDPPPPAAGTARPGGPGNPWGPPPPAAGTAPGRTGGIRGDRRPRRRDRGPGRPGNPWGAPLQDFLQVLLMNELQGAKTVSEVLKLQFSGVNFLN